MPLAGRLGSIRSVQPWDSASTNVFEPWAGGPCAWVHPRPPHGATDSLGWPYALAADPTDRWLSVLGRLSAPHEGEPANRKKVPSFKSMRPLLRIAAQQSL